MPLHGLGSGARALRDPFSLIFAVCALPFIWRVSHNIAMALRFEDAMIVLRYARNLAAGDGFVYNAGERILGVTTPLHTLLSAIYVMVGGDQAPVVQNIAGVIFLVLEAWLVAVIVKRLHSALLGALAAVLILTNLNFNYLYFGMETHLFAFLTLLAFHLYTLRKDTLTGIVLGFAFLTRYDAALLALLIGLALMIERRKIPVRLTSAFFVVTTPWLIFAFLYFGSIMPHALGAKKDYYPALGYIRYVFEYYREYFAALTGVFISSPGVQAAVSWLFPPICLAGVLGLIHKARDGLVLVAFAALQVLTYAALGPDPAFRWHYYLLNPVLTGLFLSGLYVTARFIFRLTRLRASIGRHASAGVLIAALAMASWNLHRQLDYVYQLDPHTLQLFEIADWLNARYGEETSLLQPSIGILGYATKLRIIDHAGLVTPDLYYYDGSSHTPMMEVLRRFQPDLALVSEGADQVLREHGYRQLAVFENPATLLLLQHPSKVGQPLSRSHPGRLSGGRTDGLRAELRNSHDPRREIARHFYSTVDALALSRRAQTSSPVLAPSTRPLRWRDGVQDGVYLVLETGKTNIAPKGIR